MAPNDSDHDCADDRLVLFSVVTDVATTDLQKNGRVFTNSNQAGSDSVGGGSGAKMLKRQFEQESLHLVVNVINMIIL